MLQYYQYAVNFNPAPPLSPLQPHRTITRAITTLRNAAARPRTTEAGRNGSNLCFDPVSKVKYVHKTGDNSLNHPRSPCGVGCFY
jgi:hypothetical protein